jgi:hypothetical protein
MRELGAPGFLGIDGRVHTEKMDYASFEKHWGQYVPARFSKLVWVNDWEEFKKMT